MGKLGEWLRSNREQRVWTQAALAQRIGSDSGSVSRWERGVGLPNLAQFRRLCIAFKSSADAALGLPLSASARKRARRASSLTQSRA